MEARSVLVLSFIVALLLVLPGPAFAYDDSLGAHSKINSLALSKFQEEVIPGDPSLSNAHIDNTPCRGIAWDPADGDRINPPEIAIERVKTLEMWVIDGGYSADEPEGTMALCHFYDPTQPQGKRYLTDQQSMVKVLSQYNSEYKNPGIDAVQWAFHGDQYGTVFDQQYSWDQGKSSLKKALESPDPNNVNYGKAWRSLGETMHLMADMTVPAHVRNDGHAAALNDPDPYESSTTWQLGTEQLRQRVRFGHQLRPEPGAADDQCCELYELALPVERHDSPARKCFKPVAQVRKAFSRRADPKRTGVPLSGH